MTEFLKQPLNRPSSYCYIIDRLFLFITGPAITSSMPGQHSEILNSVNCSSSSSQLSQGVSTDNCFVKNFPGLSLPLAGTTHSKWLPGPAGDIKDIGDVRWWVRDPRARSRWAMTTHSGQVSTCENVGPLMSEVPKSGFFSWEIPTFFNVGINLKFKRTLWAGQNTALVCIGPAGGYFVALGGMTTV